MTAPKRWLSNPMTIRPIQLKTGQRHSTTSKTFATWSLPSASHRHLTIQRETKGNEKQAGDKHQDISQGRSHHLVNTGIMSDGHTTQNNRYTIENITGRFTREILVKPCNQQQNGQQRSQGKPTINQQHLVKCVRYHHYSTEYLDACRACCR